MSVAGAFTPDSSAVPQSVVGRALERPGERPLRAVVALPRVAEGHRELDRVGVLAAQRLPVAQRLAADLAGHLADEEGEIEVVVEADPPGRRRRGRRPVGCRRCSC